MKIRNGFVSNSSSSSFVVAFPHKPESVEDLKQMMFGKQEWHYVGDVYDSYGRTEIPTKEIVEKVFVKIKGEATKEDVLDSIENGWFDNYLGIFPGIADVWNDPDYQNIMYKKDRDMNKIQEIHKKYDEINKKRARDIVNVFLSSNKDKYIVVVWFSDNEGEAIEEHSDIFQRLEYIRTSYH